MLAAYILCCTMTSELLYPSPSPTAEVFRFSNEIQAVIDFVLPNVEASTMWQDHQEIALDTLLAGASAPLPINDVVENEERMLTHYVVVLQEQSKCLLCPLAMACFLVALLTYSVVRKTAPAPPSPEGAPASKGSSPAGENKGTGEKCTGEEKDGERRFAHTITV